MQSIVSDFFVRVGVLSQIGRFRARDGQRYRRGARVICRTQRGLETGQVLVAASQAASLETAGRETLGRETLGRETLGLETLGLETLGLETLGLETLGLETLDGGILRRCSVEDELLLARLERNRREAYDACTELLAERGLSAVLVDVEHLFDGRSLYFYFLGPVSPEVDAITEELAAAYDAEVQFRAFSDAVQHGCGPDCGTENAAGCGSSCGLSCAIGPACNS